MVTDISSDIATYSNLFRVIKKMLLTRMAEVESSERDNNFVEPIGIHDYYDKF